MATLRNALRNQSFLLFLIATFSFFFAEGCGGGGGGGGSKTNFTLEEIVGSYEATEFELAFSDGTIITQDHADIKTWSGIMIIYPNSYAYQEFNINEFTDSAEGFFTIVKNNRIKVNTPDCDSYYINVTYNDPYLITFVPIGTCGSEVAERTKWQKVSNAVPSSELSMSSFANESTSIFNLLHKFFE